MLLNVAREAMTSPQQYKGAGRIDRIKLLLQKTHTVGRITLPIPNQSAFMYILTLKDKLNISESSENAAALARWVMESVWLLSVQNDLDKYFLDGDERERAITAFWIKRVYLRFDEYYVALIDLLQAMEKKSLNSSQAMTDEAADLIKRHTSSS